MSVLLNSQFSFQDFNELNEVSKRAFYQEANEEGKVDLVRELNGLGMKPEAPSCSGPSIISKFMDIATRHDVILHFLTKLRETNRLLTESEFKSLSSKKWIKKDRLSRILGCDHLMQKIRENNLKHIKVPLKIAVVEETESLNVSGWDYSNNLYDIHSDQIKIYAERITSVDRKLSREEIDELIQVIAASNFLDLWPQNVVVAEDGIYFIDTEFKSFAGTICWGKVRRFGNFIAEEDKEYFSEKVKEKENEPWEEEEICDYEHLVHIASKLERRNAEMSEEQKKRIESLQYVGFKKVGGNWMVPNKYSFDMKEILGK